MNDSAGQEDGHTLKAGVSVIVFTFNSVALIERTLGAIAANAPAGSDYEVLVIDNNSNDDTISRADRFLTESGIPHRIIPQPVQGLFYSRVAGIREAAYRYFIFVDDDNLLKGNWVDAVRELLDERPEIGLLGGVNKGLLEGDQPEWWETQKHAYAVGRATYETGVVNDAYAIVWGAGMAGRTHLVKMLYDHARFWLIGRTANQLLAGEDSELTYWIKMLGFKTYQSELELEHVIPSKKLTDTYLLSLHKGFRLSDQYLQQYRTACTGASWFVHFVQYGIWLKMKWLLFPIRILMAKSVEEKMDLRTKRPGFAEVVHYWKNMSKWGKIHKNIVQTKKQLLKMLPKS